MALPLLQNISMLKAQAFTIGGVLLAGVSSWSSVLFPSYEVWTVLLRTYRKLLEFLTIQENAHWECGLLWK